MIPNFRWQMQGKLAGMARPLIGLGTNSEDDVEFLKGRGITAVVSLTPTPLAPQTLADHGLDHLHVPMEDFQPPGMEQVAEFVAWTKERIAAGGRVAVHCLMGQGRTGTMLACYLVSEGSSPEEAIRLVRARLPAAIETRSQEQAVRDWFDALGNEAE